MSEYKITDQDVQVILRWLKQVDPDNANEENARDFLLSLKMSYREVGLTDPDRLEEFYQKLKNDRENTKEV